MVTLSFFGSGSEWFWAMVQTFIILGSVIFIIIQIRTQNNTNLISILNEFHDKWWKEEMRNSRSYICNNTDRDKIGVNEERVLNFFENLGILSQRKIIDTRIIWENYSYYTERYYMILKNSIESGQKEGDKTLFENFVKLHAKIMKMSKRRISKDYTVSDDNLATFIYTEKEC